MATGEDRMKLFTSKISSLIAVALSAVILVAAAVAQQTPKPPKAEPMPDAPKTIEKDKEKEKVKPGKAVIVGEMPPGVEMGEGTTTERSIAVDPKISINMCVTQGTVRINGWDRNEVRAFVSEGSKFGFRVLQKSMKGDSPVLISLVSLRETRNGMVTTGDCVAGDDVELDVPENAALTLRGREADIAVDGIRKILIDNVGGDINVSNVSSGVRAKTFQGDVTVENSQGAVVLETSSGNIVAYGVEPAEVGDPFKAKTINGTISLDKLGYRLADINSLSGTIVYSGELLSGGSLSFTTTSGAIRLMLPQETACRVTATYGWGSFDSQLPFKSLTNDVHTGPVKTINGMIGNGGDATLRVSTNSGSIQIKKLQP